MTINNSRNYNELTGLCVWMHRFKYYHWALSVLGVVLNIGLSFTAGWYIALAAFCLAFSIYTYIAIKG